MSPKADSGPKAGAGDVYFEFFPHGNSVRVCAIDAKTGTEATVMGPANAGQAALERLALNKLRYVLGKQTR